MLQYANLHFEGDATVTVDRISDSPLDADETYICIREPHMNVAFHIANDEVEGWLDQWNELLSSTYSYSDSHLASSFTVFVPRVLFDELRGKVLDHVAYLEEVKS